MGKQKAVIGSTGGGAFAVFVATAPIYYFSTPSHPSIVFWCMVGSGILCAVCILLWFVVPSAGKGHAKVSQSINTGSGDSNGPQMAAGRDFYYHAAPSPSPADPVKPSLIAVDKSQAQTQTATPPKLKISRRTEQVIFEHLQSSWRLAQQWEPESQTALVLWVENEFPMKGNGRDLPSLIASIRAEQYDSFTVSRAYWLQHRDNEVTLTSGNKLGVLIGYFSGRDTFISYRNPHAGSYQHILDDGFRPQGEKAKLSLILRDSETMPMRITVTIAQMPSQTVIACKRLIITLPQLIVDMQECE